MVALIGYPLDVYVQAIITSYILLAILAIVRFIFERGKKQLWIWKKGVWTQKKMVKYLWTVPLAGMIVLLIVYSMQVRIGVVFAVNGVLVGILVMELLNELAARR